MGASYNATMIKIGTATTFKGDFYETIQRNKKLWEDKKITLRRHFEYDYKVCQKYNPKYAKYIEKEKFALGEHSDERILIGIDELDDSMDVAAQMRMAHIWNDWIFSRYPNASILFITHSLFTVLGATHAGNCINTRCYDVSRKCYCTPEEYFASETGYSIELREIK